MLPLYLLQLLRRNHNTNQDLPGHPHGPARQTSGTICMLQLYFLQFLLRCNSKSQTGFVHLHGPVRQLRNTIWLPAVYLLQHLLRCHNNRQAGFAHLHTPVLQQGGTTGMHRYNFVLGCIQRRNINLKNTDLVDHSPEPPSAKILFADNYYLSILCDLSLLQNL